MESPIGMLSSALRAIEERLPAGRVVVDSAMLERETKNTLALERRLAGIVYPETTDEVALVVRTAGAHHLPLYPVSRGRNIGYGEKLPVRDGALLVDLQRMNRIRSFDEELGHVVVEPGVTQAQLYEFLQSHGGRYWMDATGAGLDSSIVGNTLEGGFGHTPRGNRRASFTDVEVVLGTGEVLRTGTFPGLGPDLAGLFVQSSFGIVTSMQLALFPAPARFVSFLARVRDDAGLPRLIDALRSLRQDGTLTSLVHVANATRGLITTRPCPPEFADRLISCEDARRLMTTPLVKVGTWSAIGGLYGHASEIRGRRKVLARALKGVADLTFFGDAKIRFAMRLFRTWPFCKLRSAEAIRRSLASFAEMHGLMKGVPSDEPLRNILWRAESREDMGLIWFAPTTVAVGREVGRMVAIAEPLFAEHRFEMPLTVTLVTPERVVGAFSISFSTKRPEETARAHRLYSELKAGFARAGIGAYRAGVLGMEALDYAQTGKRWVLEALKRELDPGGVISPGRYGIG